MSENILRYPVPQLINGRVVTTEIVKHGPVVFMVTTTRPTLHSENETRTLSLEIDDSVAQTRRVIQKQSQTVGLNSFPTETIYHRWQDFQRLLRILGNKRPGGCWEVTVPFAPALGAIILPKATRFRRDYVQILVAIKAHALLHCYRRETNERGEIVADLELDYLPIAKLMESAACEAVGITADKYVRQTAEAVKIATINMQPDEGATAYQVGQQLNLDKSTASRRLKVAAKKGFVTNLETRKATTESGGSATKKWTRRPTRCCRRSKRSGHGCPPRATTKNRRNRATEEKRMSMFMWIVVAGWIRPQRNSRTIKVQTVANAHATTKPMKT
jgi:hypothetical protein